MADKFEKAAGVLVLWAARAGVTILIFTALAYLLGGVDPTIRYSVSATLTVLLAKEVF